MTFYKKRLFIKKSTKRIIQTFYKKVYNRIFMKLNIILYLDSLIDK